MNIVEVKNTLSKVWIILVAILGVASIGFMSKAMADDGTANNGQRMVTIYDRGVEQTIITRAHTVGEALTQARVQLDAADLVEPSASSELVAERYSINVYRARPVIVEDGVARVRTITAAQSPAKIADAAHITLYPEDKTATARIDDVVTEGGAGLKLTIDRATPFTFVLYGKTLADARSQAATVGDMLKEKGVKLGEDDGVSAPLTAPLIKGMTVTVWRNGVQTMTQEEDIAMPTEQVKDQDREVGYKEVQTPGKPGKKQVTYEVDMRDGVEVSRKAIQEVTTTEPVKQVEVIGAKIKVFSGSCGEWISAAGVTANASTNYLIEKESHCNPNAVNASSGACGIGQALPCSKMGAVNSDGTSAVDPVGQLKWMNNYVIGRYGSWDAAAAFHRAHGWY